MTFTFLISAASRLVALSYLKRPSLPELTCEHPDRWA